MGNQIFRDRLESRISSALVEAQNCSRIAHPGMVGRIRQIMVENLLKPLLPEGFHIGAGKITDAKGNLSSETDVIIYDRRSIPPVLYDEKEGVFPVETVHYSIEIKSRLTAAELVDSVKNGIRLRSLFQGHFPHSAIFAFESDLTSSTEAERIIQTQNEHSPPLPVNVFCRSWKTVRLLGCQSALLEMDNARNGEPRGRKLSDRCN